MSSHQHNQQQQQSSTQTMTEDATQRPILMLSIRPSRHVQFTPDWVDNEGAGKKKTKKLDHVISC